MQKKKCSMETIENQDCSQSFPCHIFFFHGWNHTPDVKTVFKKIFRASFYTHYRHWKFKKKNINGSFVALLQQKQKQTLADLPTEFHKKDTETSQCLMGPNSISGQKLNMTLVTWHTILCALVTVSRFFFSVTSQSQLVRSCCCCDTIVAQTDLSHFDQQASSQPPCAHDIMLILWALILTKTPGSSTWTTVMIKKQ